MRFHGSLVWLLLAAGFLIGAPVGFAAKDTVPDRSCYPGGIAADVARDLGLSTPQTQRILDQIALLPFIRDSLEFTELTQNYSPIFFRSSKGPRAQVISHPLLGSHIGKETLEALEEIDLKYMTILGLELPKQTHIVIQRPSLIPKVVGPTAHHQEIRILGYGRADATIILDGIRHDHMSLVKSKFVLAHERAHLALEETFKSNSILADTHRNLALVEGVCDFLAFFSTGEQGFKSSVHRMGRDISAGEVYSGKKSKIITTLSQEITDPDAAHKTSLIYSRFLHDLANAVPFEHQSEFFKEYLSLLDRLAHLVPAIDPTDSPALMRELVELDLTYLTSMALRVSKGKKYASEVQRAIEVTERSNPLATNGARTRSLREKVLTEREPRRGASPFVSPAKDSEELARIDRKAQVRFAMNLGLTGVKGWMVYEAIDGLVVPLFLTNDLDEAVPVKEKKND